ncbi:MAG: protein kinase [Anaerolineae bacterium]|nr:protein kinase [Anaerolineae bacterium]
MAGSDPLIGKKLGDYIIVDVLGQGGMARVYRGLDKKLNRYAAVKVIDAHLVSDDQDEYRQRFQNEARSIARLNHPNIVGIYQFDQVGTTYYMAMSFIEGKDLRTVLKNHAKNGTRMGYPEIRRVIKDIADALDYAHRENVIHRDVKPSNIMVTAEGKGILTDFGLALNTTEGTIGNTFGSAHYIAPEQAVSSAQAVPQSDLYSLGVVLFEMLTNRVPFNDPSAMAVAMKHLNEQPQPPSRINPNLSPKVDDVVMKALDKDPKRRFPTGGAMVTALDFAFAISSGDLESSKPDALQPLPSWGDSSRPSSLSRPTAGTPLPTDSRASRPASESWDSPSRARPAGLMPDAPTVTDSKKSAANRAEMQKYQQKLQHRSRRTRLMVIFAVVGTIAVALALLVLSNMQGGGGDSTLTPTIEVSPSAEVVAVTSRPTQGQALGLFPSATPDESATEESTIEPTDTARPTTAVPVVVVESSDTPAPTDAPPTATTPPTATRQPPTATSQPPTPTLTDTPVLNLPVLLRWTQDSFTLLNQSDAEVNVSNLSFVQVSGGEDVNRIFESRLWNGGSRQPSDLPAGDCFQIFRDSLGFIPDAADYCGTRHAVWQASIMRWFWVNTDDSVAVFEVRRAERVLASCLLSDGECSFDPGF